MRKLMQHTKYILLVALMITMLISSENQFENTDPQVQPHIHYGHDVETN